MSAMAEIERELLEIKQAIEVEQQKKQVLLHEIEASVKAQMAAGQTRLKITLPIGIVVGLALWGIALYMNLSKNTGQALETYPCAVPIFLVIFGIIAVVLGIWLGIPKENQIRKQANEARAVELEAIKNTLGPLQLRERQLQAELERERYRR